jgi:DNA-binding CsgD family transcriptional regulator
MTPMHCHDFIDSLSQAGSVEAVHEVCAQLCHECDFEQFIFGASIPTSFVKPYVIIISGYPTEWRERYTLENYIQIDPTVVHCAQHHLPLVWQEMERQDPLHARVRGFMEEARDFGLVSGVSFPLHTAQGDFAMLSLASADPHRRSGGRIREAMPFGQLLVAYVHEAVRRIFQQDLLPVTQANLTSREKECLLWVSEGKTAWETSQILRISERTVTFHLQNVVDKLGVVNRQQAIARAVTLGLIQPQLG